MWNHRRFLNLSVRLVRYVLAGLFLYAAAGKFADLEGFARTIDGFGLVPSAAVPGVAVTLPVLEVAAAGLLALNLRGGLALTTGLLVLFIVVLVHGIRMGLDVDCGCFGPEDTQGEAYHGLTTSLLRDWLMLAGCLWIWLRTAAGKKNVRLVRSLFQK